MDFCCHYQLTCTSQTPMNSEAHRVLLDKHSPSRPLPSPQCKVPGATAILTADNRHHQRQIPCQLCSSSSSSSSISGPQYVGSATAGVAASVASLPAVLLLPSQAPKLLCPPLLPQPATAAGLLPALALQRLEAAVCRVAGQLRPGQPCAPHCLLVSALCRGALSTRATAVPATLQPAPPYGYL